MVSSKNILILLTFHVTLTLGAAPLRCLLRESKFFDVFSSDKVPASFYDVYKIAPIELDPIRIDEVTVDQDDIKFTAKNLVYTGFSDAIIDEFGISFKTNLTRIFFHSDISGNGDYKLSGLLFKVPINGEGHVTTLFKNLKIEMVMPFQIIRDDNGRRYVDLKTYYHWHDVSSNGEFHLSGLYNDNKQLRDTTLSLVNQNFRVFVQQFGKPFLDKIVSHIYNVFRNYMLASPLKDDYSTC